MFQVIDIKGSRRLEEYKKTSFFSGIIDDLQFKAKDLAKKLRGKTVWMINSSANGGGVAEMMPKLVNDLRQLGIHTEWVVFSPDDKQFFPLTKRIHNLIHDFGLPGFSNEEKALYEAISRRAAKRLEKSIAAHDLLVVHDPQPLGLGAELKRRIGIKTIWRCHIGLDQRTPKTASAWNFLKPYIDSYDHAVFSAPGYLPSFLKQKSSVITPAIDPLSHKNRDLSSLELIKVLYKSGIIKNGHHLHLNPIWKHKALKLNSNGRFVDINKGGGTEMLYRPTVTQISRWDRLKGWESLIEGFVLLKRAYRNNGHKKSPNYMNVSATQLILAGPEPAAVKDDPEGKAVLDGLCDFYKNLPAEDQKDVSILSLPMTSIAQNHLMVNALQRSSSLVVQNSLQEGFGLTATEAMWKKIPVLGTSACGLRQQIRDRRDGRLTTNPTDAKEIAENLKQILSKPNQLERWGQSAQKRVYEYFLIFKQLEKWMDCLSHVIVIRNNS